jgi:heterotetrameric sarcosine oxidase gamma subunit
VTVRLVKRSALAAAGRRLGATFVQEHDWQLVADYGDPEAERRSLRDEAVIVDWSHVGKITVRGTDAPAQVARLEPRAVDVPRLSSCSRADVACLRLTDDEFLVMCPPGDDHAADALDADATSVVVHGGGTGCLVLAGPRRDETLERSCATNLRRDRVVPGSVVQTTMHFVHCTLWRTEDLDVIFHSRDLSESLFDAFLDVGMGVGLRPAGLATVPVRLPEL